MQTQGNTATGTRNNGATAAKPTAAKPTAAKPTAAKPTAAKPTAQPPAAPPTAQPTAAPPTAITPAGAVALAMAINNGGIAAAPPTTVAGVLAVLPTLNPATAAAIAAANNALPPANLFNTVAVLHAYHTRGTTAHVSYRVAGCTGIVFVPCAVFVAATAPAAMYFGLVPFANGSALAYNGPLAGGKLGRSGYKQAGMRGVFVVCNTLMHNVAAPATLYVNVALAQPTAAPAATTTAAVLAAGNVAVHGNGQPVAAPAVVAAVAAPAGVVALAQASK